MGLTHDEEPQVFPLSTPGLKSKSVPVPENICCQADCHTRRQLAGGRLVLVRSLKTIRYTPTASLSVDVEVPLNYGPQIDSSVSSRHNQRRFSPRALGVLALRYSSGCMEVASCFLKSANSRRATVPCVAAAKIPRY
jgi:hypothetical protein